MSRNKQKKNPVKIKKIEQSIVEEEPTKYSLFESKDDFIYEKAMLMQI